MSTVTREQILREVGVEASNPDTPVSRMKPGTLALDPAEPGEWQRLKGERQVLREKIQAARRLETP